MEHAENPLKSKQKLLNFITMKNFNQTNEFQVEKLEERLEMASWQCDVLDPGEVDCNF